MTTTLGLSKRHLSDNPEPFQQPFRLFSFPLDHDPPVLQTQEALRLLVPAEGSESIKKDFFYEGIQERGAHLGGSEVLKYLVWPPI